MPIPWHADLLQARAGPGDRDGNRIPAQNGITLAQLRNTAKLLSRLCKTGLLRHTSEFSRASGEYGCVIKWTRINMHNISQEVIKKIIHEENSCSWVEICSRKAQKPKVFVSHNWSEPFRDFMTAIELYTNSAGIGVHDAFFICTFANDQWNVDLGETLQESPFYLALSGAEQVVLMLDKTGSALSRIWCVFEMRTTLEKGTPLSIATPLGLMGVKAAAASSMSSSQVVEVLKSVDVSQAQATNPVDQRQIMNSIAGVQEEQGLWKDAKGRKYLKDDRKAESGGALAYKYEEELIRDKPQGFSNINDFIRQYAEDSKKENEVGCTVADPALRAMTLAQLRVMARRAESYFFHPSKKQWREEKKIKSWEDIKLFHLICPFFMEFCEERGKKSYMECVADGPQPPAYLMTQAFTSSVKELMESLEWHAEARGLPGSVTYWFLPASMLKEEADEYITTHCLPPSFCAMDYYLGGVVLLGHNADILTRALPTLEIHGILRDRKVMDLACPWGALATTRPFHEGWEFGHFERDLAERVLQYDVSKVTGKVEFGYDHAEMTKCKIAGLEYHAGDKAPEGHQSYVDFNSRLRSKALGPVLRGVSAKDALQNGSTDELRKSLKIDDCVGTALTNSSLRGLLGESALHIAAASGSGEAVQMLVEHGANPNSQDNDGETPLHYAAMAGQKDSARVLLENGADAHVESYFMETAVFVAEQNAATFLGIDTSDVLQLLRNPPEPKPQTARSTCGRRRPCAAVAAPANKESGGEDNEAAATSGCGGHGVPAKKTKEGVALVHKTFQACDPEGKGTIPKDALMGVFGKLLPALGPDDITKLLEAMDMGNSEEIDYSLFVKQIFADGSAPAP